MGGGYGTDGDTGPGDWDWGLEVERVRVIILKVLRLLLLLILLRIGVWPWCFAVENGKRGVIGGGWVLVLVLLGWIGLCRSGCGGGGCGKD